jgi:hypothetical protein
MSVALTGEGRVGSRLRSAVCQVGSRALAESRGSTWVTPVE